MKFILPTYQEKQKQMTYDPTTSTLRTLHGRLVLEIKIFTILMFAVSHLIRIRTIEVYECY